MDCNEFDLNGDFKILDLDTDFLSRIPEKKGFGLTSVSIEFTCIDSTEDFIAVGSNVGLVFIYHRKSAQLISFPTIVSGIYLYILVGRIFLYTIEIGIQVTFPFSLPT